MSNDVNTLYILEKLDLFLTSKAYRKTCFFSPTVRVIEKPVQYVNYHGVKGPPTVTDEDLEGTYFDICKFILYFNSTFTSLIGYLHIVLFHYFKTVIAIVPAPTEGKGMKRRTLVKSVPTTSKQTEDSTPTQAVDGGK